VQLTGELSQCRVRDASAESESAELEKIKVGQLRRVVSVAVPRPVVVPARRFRY